MTNIIKNNNISNISILSIKNFPELNEGLKLKITNLIELSLCRMYVKSDKKDFIIDNHYLVEWCKHMNRNNLIFKVFPVNVNIVLLDSEYKVKVIKFGLEG